MPGSDAKAALTWLLLLGGCAHSAPICKPILPGQYFPAGTFQDPKSSLQEDAFIQEWYGENLCAMEEAPLYQRPADETYRFLWLRSFHHPVAVRVETAHGKASLVAVELDGEGGDEPGRIERRTTRALRPQEWTSLTSALEAASFWEAPQEQPYTERGEDGAEWIFEGWRPGTYHVLTRWSPKSGPFRALGEAFLDAAGFSFPRSEMY